MEKNKQRTLLLVEDSPTQALSLRLMLEDAGLCVLTALNGSVGVEMAYVHKPDVVVLDLEMPYMDGFEASALISGDYRTEHTPIIILTSHEGKKQALKSRMLGAARFIHKDSCSSQRLLEELRNLKILDNRPAGAL